MQPSSSKKGNVGRKVKSDRLKSVYNPQKTTVCKGDPADRSVGWYGQGAISDSVPGSPGMLQRMSGKIGGLRQ